MKIWYNCRSIDPEQLERYDHVITDRDHIQPIAEWLGYRWVHLSNQGLSGIRDKIDLPQLYSLTPDQVYYRITQRIPVGTMYGSFQTKYQVDPRAATLRLIREHRNSNSGVCLNLFDQNIWKGYHVYGWEWVLQNLPSNPQGIVCDTYVDHNFTHGLSVLTQARILPYTCLWVGFIHHGYSDSVKLFQNPIFRESCKSCIKLIVLSDSLRLRLQPHTPVPIVSLYHPIPPNLPAVNRYRRLVQIGAWYRIDSIGTVNTDWEKYRIQAPFTQGYQKTEGVIDLPTLSPNDYRNFVCSSVVYLHLSDASAVNTICECIAWNVPILVNRLPGVEDYLGKDYPLFFTSGTQIPQLLSQVDLAEKYLSDLDKSKFTLDTFQNRLLEILREEKCLLIR